MDDRRRQRESILSVAVKWLPWCLGLVFALTIAWAVFVARVEVQNADGRGSEEIAVAVAIKVAATLPLIFLCSLFITTVLDLSGGAIMVTARYLTDKFLDPWREKVRAETEAEVRAEAEAEVRAEAEAEGIEIGKAEGIEVGKAQGIEVGKVEGLAQKQREWEVWLREKEDAAERGEPFDKPPPSL